MRNTLIATVLSIAGISTLTLAGAASHPIALATAKSTAPASSTVSRGHTLFLSNCAPCHGAQAQGDDGPNLHHIGLTPEAISSTVTHGIKDEMPSFKTKIKGADLKAVVAYVHSLQ